MRSSAMRTRALASLAVLLTAASALSGCGSDDGDARVEAGSDIGRIQDYGPIELDGVTHIGDLTLPALDDEDLTPLTVGATAGGYVRTSERGDNALTHTELFSSGGRLEREFVTSGVALTDPDAGTAAWVEVAKGRHTLVLTDLVARSELGRWQIADDSLLTALRGEEAALMTDDGSAVVRAGDRRPTRLTFVNDDWMVSDLGEEQVLATDLEESVTFSREGMEIGSAKGVYFATLSPDGTQLIGFREKDDYASEAVLSTLDGEVEQVEVDGQEPYGLTWRDADTFVVATGAPDGDDEDSSDDADSDFRRYVCQVGSGDCTEIPRPEGVRWVGFLMPNDVRAALSTIVS